MMAPYDAASTRHCVVALAAALWALIFAVFHIVWAAGSYVGLDPEGARQAFARPWFLPYDLVVSAMCLIAVPAALALVMPWGQRVPRRLLLTVTWIGTVLLALRAGAGLIQAVYELVTGRFSFARLGIWEPWFYVGAVLFVANLWMYSRRHATRTS
jgi:Protein of unknown function (DUF3995)